MRYLGIDYGLKKMGLAISEGMVASPLRVIDISGLSDAVNKINQVIKKEEIDGGIVIGIPESGESRKIVKKFIQEMKRYIKVYECDETLTTHQAGNLMMDLGLSQKKRSREDAYSAVLILDNFLAQKTEDSLTN